MVDVARLAEVSVGTVSAVLNMSSAVRPRLRGRVQEAMKVLDYHPNQIARSLKMQRTYTVGMVVPDIANPFFTSVARGVEMTSQLHGYSVFLCDTNEDTEQERQQLSTLYTRQVDGILISSSNYECVRDRLARRRFPVVFFDRVPRGYKGDAVLTDNLSAAYQAVRCLIQLGHRRIAIITGNPDLSVVVGRMDGYRKAMQEAGLPIPVPYAQQGDFTLASGHRCGVDLMRLPEPPTAIFSCNNLMTLGLMGALLDLNVACPKCVSVLGFDDFDWAASFNPRLTTMAQQMLEMGRSAMEMLVRRIESPIVDPDNEQGRTVVLEAELRVRDSTAPPRNYRRR